MHHQAGRLAEAAQLYREILAAEPTNISALNNLGAIVPQAEAVTLLRRAVQLKPDHAEAFVNLGNVLKGLGEIDDAVTQYKRAVELRPNFVGALHNIANALQTQHKYDEAEMWYERALAIEPDHPSCHFGLGCVYQAQKKIDAAIARYERAIAINPRFVEALHNLGTVHDSVGRSQVAAKWFRWALSIDPNITEGNIGMVKILEGEGRLAEASVFRDRVPKPIDMVTEAASGPLKRTVLIPSVVGPGNVPVHSLISGKDTTVIRWYADYATDAQEQSLPACNVIFNGVGNADLSDPSHERLARVHARRKMLNPPDIVARTRRDRLPALLAGIPDVVIPAVARLRRDELINADLAALLAQRGIVCPVLMRPVATHGGEGMVLIETPEQLAQLTLSDSDAFYFIQFANYRSTDGLWRKYRTIFVDRVPYPYHLAISERWLVHYYSANMVFDSKKEEEHAFLADSASVIGPKATAALVAIAQRLDLDFGGIDYSVLADGRVLVFEANANMSIYLPDTPGDYPYKLVYVPKIVQAFDAMLAKYETKI